MLPCFIIQNENIFYKHKTFPGYFLEKKRQRNRLICEKFMKQKSIKSLLWKHEKVYDFMQEVVGRVFFLGEEKSRREWNEIYIFQKHDLKSGGKEWLQIKVFDEALFGEFISMTSYSTCRLKSKRYERWKRNVTKELDFMMVKKGLYVKRRSEFWEIKNEWVCSRRWPWLFVVGRKSKFFLPAFFFLLNFPLSLFSCRKKQKS